MFLLFQVLNANVSVCMTDGVESDSASELEVGMELIRQWENEFLQERLQELLRAAADEDRDDSEKQVQKKIYSLNNKSVTRRSPTVCDVRRTPSV